MDHQRKALKTGAAALILAISLRLVGGGILNPLAQVLQEPAALSFLVYLQTGRAVRFAEAAPVPTIVETQPAETTVPQATETTQPEDKPVFSLEDLENVSVTYGCGRFHLGRERSSTRRSRKNACRSAAASSSRTPASTVG